MITVKVTKSDISRAIKLTNPSCGSYRTCPIALALKRTQKKKVVICSAEDITIDGRCYSAKDEQSKIVNNFIDRFDSDKNVKPIKFNLYTEKF